MKKQVKLLDVFVFLFIAIPMSLCGTHPRHRILVSTDIGGTDPDDNQSMIHLLMYANEFDIEGLVSSPSFGDGSKDEILRMIELYEKDLPKLQRGLKQTYGDLRSCYPTPRYLRSITKQGVKGMPKLCGFSNPTEGSDWIVKCARKKDARPLWILVWGGLEDVAQALHDAPDIADKIRIYWIGGPNKKWGCNAYTYIAENHKDLWFIENNATYRGFIGSKKKSEYDGLFWETHLKNSGMMGGNFIKYYNGVPKMGDTPSLLYLMNGNPDYPNSDHWGGRFERMEQSPRYMITGVLTPADTVACYSILEWRIKGPDIGAASSDSACMTLDIAGQKWTGYYIGNGIYSVRYSPKAPGKLSYVISSEIQGFPEQVGAFTVGDKWPGLDYNTLQTNKIEPCPISLGKDSQWYTDCQDYTSEWQGSRSIECWRNEIMKDWTVRLRWLK